MQYFESSEENVVLNVDVLKQNLSLSDDLVEKTFHYVNLYLDWVDFDYKLQWFLTHGNMHSFSVILIQWLDMNKNNLRYSNSNVIDSLSELFDMIFKCMICVVFKDGDVFVNGRAWHDLMV